MPDGGHVQSQEAADGDAGFDSFEHWMHGRCICDIRHNGIRGRGQRAPGVLGIPLVSVEL